MSLCNIQCRTLLLLFNAECWEIKESCWRGQLLWSSTDVQIYKCKVWTLFLILYVYAYSHIHKYVCMYISTQARYNYFVAYFDVISLFKYITGGKNTELSWTSCIEIEIIVFLLAYNKLLFIINSGMHTDEECMLYCRYVSAQRFSEALDILHSGACIQLEHGQVILLGSWLIFIQMIHSFFL